MKEKNKPSIYRGLSLAAAAALAFMPLLTSAQAGKEGDYSWKPDFVNSTRHARVCNKDDGNPQTASCDARVVTDSSGKAKNFVAPSGYGPAQFAEAYGFGSGASSKTIAIVDAYDDPNIISDLKTYDSQFGLACGAGVSSTTCFKKVDQNGGTHYPAANAGWALEISLDVEIAHAACPSCSILLVEASSSSYANLLAAEDTATKAGATVISNSWGGGEFNGETFYDSHFNKPGLPPITFSSGDSGYGVEYPAASKYVTAVGGTSLIINGTVYGSETAWSGAGSGCSFYESKPAWQHDTDCTKRTVADVSADADPATGAAVYDSVRYQGVSGWFQVGGTSLASPLIAAAYATGTPLPTGTAGNQMPYLHTASLHDVTSGSNGSCGGSYLCTSKAGYDGPTGLGSPNGTSGF